MQSTIVFCCLEYVFLNIITVDMKKLNLLVMIILLSYLATSQSIEKTYQIPSPVLESNDGFTKVSFDNAMITAEQGSPAIPYFAIKLLLPPGHVATSIEFSGGKLNEIQGDYTLFPYQPSSPLSEPRNGEFIINNDIYNSNTKYPGINTGGISTSYLYGHSIALSTFSPIVYNPLNGKLSYYTEVNIKIHYSPARKAAEALNNHIKSKKVEEYICNYVQNPTSIIEYNSQRSRSDSTYSLLIITPDQFSDSYTELTTIYLERGIVSEIATTESIANSMAGQDLQEKIRNYIIQEYQNHEVEYVILGGDVEYIPHRGFYCYVESGSGYTNNNIPADLYYSALDGSWNDDGDNNWGEPDEDDLLPEVAVARFPFSTSAELENIIHKCVYYQNYPVLGELVKPLLAGEHLYSGPDTWGRDYLDLLIGEHSDNGYTTVGIPETYPVDSIYEYHAPWYGSTIMSHINQGKQFVHHVGHANPQYVAHMYITDITNANFNGANGVDHNYTLFHTHGCDCGAFDGDDCILEKMVTIDNFAVAVIGNSRYGWFNEGQNEGPAAHLHREMVDAIYNEEINHLGKAFVESKIQTAPWVEAPGQHEEGALRWNFYDINILGDPVLSIWTNEPVSLTVITEEELEVGTEETDVNVSSGGSPLGNFTCTIIKDGVLHATGVTDTVGDVTLLFDPVVTEPGEAMLIVVGYNSLPDTSYINFIPSGEAYVIYNEHVVNDSSGNNNGFVDYGETIYLDLEVKNQGVLDAANVLATLITEDNYTSIIDENEQYGNIASGDSVLVETAFAFEIGDSVPDNHLIEFELMCESEGTTWVSTFEIVVFAPEPQIMNLTIDDSIGGNGNGRLDPGEEAILQLSVSNTGQSSCSSTEVELMTDNNYLEINPSMIILDTLEPGSSMIAEFNIVVDNQTPIGTAYEIESSINMCGYFDSEIYYDAVGLVIEDFETGDFSAFDWQFGGDENWIVVDQDPFNGNFSSKSGSIGDEDQSELTITIYVMNHDIITFSSKVSSEDGFDFLRFYIDGNQYDEWSGEKDWETYSYEITPGEHELMWSYEKDINSTGGYDCSWLDDVIFPPSTTIIDIGESSLVEDIIIYPNPSAGIFKLRTNSIIGDSEITIFNAVGSILSVNDKYINKGVTMLDLNQLNTGIYFVQIKSDEYSLIKKVVIK